MMHPAFRTRFFLFVFASIFISCGTKKQPSEPQEFEASFFTLLASMEPGENCTEPHTFYNVQEGEGEATLLGDFTTQLRFCIDTASFEYVGVEGSFVAENGDEIFLAGEGQVVPTKKEGYDMEFMDEFKITGGTGRFEGATGSGKTESYVNMKTNRTDHVWSGTIKIK